MRTKTSPLIPREAANEAAVDEEEDEAVDEDCPGRITGAELLIIRKKTRTWRVLISVTALNLSKNLSTSWQ